MNSTRPSAKKSKLIPRAIFDASFIPPSLSTNASENSGVWNTGDKKVVSQSWVKDFLLPIPKNECIIGLKQTTKTISSAEACLSIDFILIEQPGNTREGKPHRMIYDHLLLACYLRHINVFLMSSDAASMLAAHFGLKRCTVIAIDVSSIFNLENVANSTTLFGRSYS